MLFVLGAIWLTDAYFVYALMRGDALLARSALLVAIDIILLLITVIGGRIVPVFTANALRGRGLAADIRNSRWTDGIAIGAMITVVLVDVLAPWHPIAGVSAAFAAIAQAWRLTGWRSLRTVNEPLVWSLHIAYAWLPAGLAMKAIYVLTGATWAAHWLHALTIGAAASMILAVMTALPWVTRADPSWPQGKSRSHTSCCALLRWHGCSRRLSQWWSIDGLSCLRERYGSPRSRYS